MTDKCTVDFEPLGRRARVASGATLLEAARQAGVGLNAVCGGAGTCGTCRVRVVAGKVSPPTEAERELVAEGLRLACQVCVLGDARVDVPPDSITAAQRAQVEGRERTVELDPAARGFDVTLAPSNLDDLRADVTRLREALVQQHDVTLERFDPAALRQLPLLLRENEWRIRIVIKDNELIAVAPPDAPPLGLAVDIGTTKVAAYLVDLANGEALGAAGVMNPQIAYGEDVMARITYGMDGRERAQELQRALASGLDELAGELCAQAGRESGEIVEAVLVGNTCMHHLALGLPADSLGLAPYVAVLSDSYDLKARDLGLSLSPGASVHMLPNIAGFVGADHVAMLLATSIHETDVITVGLDIGTNTEISLAAGGRLLSCSCASGPAFEGAHIHDGMRAAPGAIERVRFVDGRIEYQTIDGAPPVGICGSGILDAVAELRRVSALRANGAMQADGHPRVRGEGRGVEFVLVPAGERDAPRDIVVTRKDVNEIQLAKAAIRAGVEVLLDEAGLEAEQVQQVVVAGAFGTYLDVDSALAIGMFPPLPRERFVQVGNAAGMGAKLALLSRHCRRQAEEIARRVEYVELTTNPRFVGEYTKALMLP
ncbi:MAG: ferredoxin [Chloroflexi bacterium]|nr:MAG: ferredoxin [Chloroflexota bacterium]RLC79792.1 MAG: ferredoxin [Chloroflexota bacterium]